MQRISFLQPDWRVPRNVRAVSTFRSGGVSARPYDDFNLADHVGDRADSVVENRRILKHALRLPSEPQWLEQVHGDRVVEAGDEMRPRADACVARKSGQVCAILTADCLPILFASRSGDRVAATHCGWRGFAAGIIDTTIGALGLHGSEITAWLGPAIGPAAYEVGDDVRIACLARDPIYASAFAPNAKSRWQCDLYALARLNLQHLGVDAIYGGGYCTFTEEERFFSYRRDGQCGRMATLVWLE